MTPIALLKSLADSPDQQAAQALAMLGNPAATFDVIAALDALEKLAPPEARPRLLELYAKLDANGVRLDAGGTVRAACLRALRPVAQRADLVLVERAALTEEFLPPGRQEVCAGLRAAAVIAMADLEPESAALHAVRLLRDPHENKMSGEPSLTAARVLGALGATLPLYDYALAPGSGAPEVVAECMRALEDLPGALVRELAVRYAARLGESGGRSAEAVGSGAIVGLAELIMARDDRNDLAAEYAALLATDDLDLLEFLVTLAMGRRTGDLVDALLREATWETDGARAAAIRNGLVVAKGEARVDELIARLERVEAGKGRSA